jgi:putative SOS response-associated peptidase YedK
MPRRASTSTTAPNDVVRPVHSKAMPVMLTDPAEWDAWLGTDAGTALKLQPPLPADRLRVVALDQREGDGVVDAREGQQGRLALDPDRRPDAGSLAR